MDPQHPLQGHGLTATAPLGVVWLDQGHKPGPANHGIHLGQKAFSLGLPAAPRQAGLFGKGHLSGHGGISSLLGQPIVSEG